MNRIYLLLILNIFLLLIPIFISKSNYIDNFLEDFDIKYEKTLKKFLKKYLIKNDLFGNNRLIEPKELKKIFLDVMLEGAPIDEIDNYTKEIYENLAKMFIEKYYKEKIKIRGKDIYDLININEIINKFYELNGEIPLYDNYEDIVNDDDLDDDEHDDSDDIDNDYYQIL